MALSLFEAMRTKQKQFCKPLGLVELSTDRHNNFGPAGPARIARGTQEAADDAAAGCGEGDIPPQND
jgi:hypothetical protein